MNSTTLIVTGHCSELSRPPRYPTNHNYEFRLHGWLNVKLIISLSIWAAIETLLMVVDRMVVISVHRMKDEGRVLQIRQTSSLSSIVFKGVHCNSNLDWILKSFLSWRRATVFDNGRNYKFCLFLWTLNQTALGSTLYHSDCEMKQN